VTGRRADQVLLPTVGLLGGISLLLMERLPQSLVTQSLAGRTFGLASIQLGWLVLSLAVVTIAAIAVRSDAWLRRYKYTWAAAGIGLLLLTFLFGNEVNGALLTIQVGPFSGQPTELIKVILVIFLAGYLSEFRPLLVEANMRLGPLRLPPVPYLLPMLAMWAIALGIVVVQRDLGAALLFFAVFLPWSTSPRPGRATWSSAWPCSWPAARLPTSSLGRSAIGSTSGSTRSPMPAARATRWSSRCTPSVGAGSWAPAWVPACPSSAAGCRSRRSTPTFRSPPWARSWA
jgi:hypothetical protein